MPTREQRICKSSMHFGVGFGRGHKFLDGKDSLASGDVERGRMCKSLEHRFMLLPLPRMLVIFSSVYTDSSLLACAEI